MSSRLILLALSVSIGFSAEPDSQKMAVFEGEKLAEWRMMLRLRDHIKASGAVLKKVVPKPAVKTDKFTSFGVELQVLGDSKQLADSIGKIEDRDRFEVISLLEIVPDKKDAKVQNAKLVLSDWYALDEGAAAQVDGWRKVANPSVPAIDIYAAWIDCFGDLAVRFTSFEFREKAIKISGEGREMNVAGKFGGRLFTDDRLSDYHWSWDKRPARPAYDLKKQDGSIEFAIHGKRIEGAAKKPR